MKKDSQKHQAGHQGITLQGAMNMSSRVQNIVTNHRPITPLLTFKNLSPKSISKLENSSR